MNRAVVACLALAVLTTACNLKLATPTPFPLQGGILVTFGVGREEFRVWISNPHTIQQVLDLRDGRGRACIPVGVVRRGPGEWEHNLPWHWHLDPVEIELSEMAIELCDCVPSQVEARIDYFVDTLGRFCPQGARLLLVQDLREMPASPWGVNAGLTKKE